jgi:hypothetical protein
MVAPTWPSQARQTSVVGSECVHNVVPTNLDLRYTFAPYVKTRYANEAGPTSPLQRLRLVAEDLVTPHGHLSPPVCVTGFRGDACEDQARRIDVLLH